MGDLEIRRPELRDVEREGTVRWWKDDKGYGRITADDGEVLFAHFSGLLSNRAYRELAEGERVTFVWRGGLADHGRHVADEVRVVGEGPVIPGEPPILSFESEDSITVDGQPVTFDTDND